MSKAGEVKVAITGSAGRMGMRLVALARQSGHFKVVGALERAGHPSLGRDAGEVAGVGAIGCPITVDLGETPDVLIDFTAPVATRHWISLCRQKGVAMVIGTTGLQPGDHQ